MKLGVNQFGVRELPVSPETESPLESSGVAGGNLSGTSHVCRATPEVYADNNRTTDLINSYAAPHNEELSYVLYLAGGFRLPPAWAECLKIDEVDVIKST